MLKISLLQNAIKSTLLVRIGGLPNHGLRSLLWASPRHFSTEGEPTNQQATSDPFLQTPQSGLVYGRLLGITKHTLKTDILSLLEGCNLSMDDIKIDYSRFYVPSAVLIQFPSRTDYTTAIRAVAKKGQLLYKLDRTDRANWDYIQPYDGKSVLLQGIPPNALQDDVERFLSGCTYDASSIRMFFRPMQGNIDPMRMAIVRFASETLATDALLTKNRGFCLNNQILLRVLH